jgi:hypothetical protein
MTERPPIPLTNIEERYVSAFDAAVSRLVLAAYAHHPQEAEACEEHLRAVLLAAMRRDTAPQLPVMPLEDESVAP